MDTGDAALLALGILWLSATIGCLLSILIELVWWLWKGLTGVVITIEDEGEEES